MSENGEVAHVETTSGRGAPWKGRTHCLRGHEYTPDNTYWRSHGARRCRTCKLERGRNYYAEHGKAARAASTGDQ